MNVSTEKALRDEIQNTRDDVSATVNELADRLDSTRRAATTPLIACGVALVGALAVVLLLRKRQNRRR